MNNDFGFRVSVQVGEPNGIDGAHLSIGFSPFDQPSRPRKHVHVIHRSDHDVGAAVSVEIVYSDDLYEVEGGRLPNQLVISVLRHRASPGEDEQVDFRIFVEIGCEEGTRLEATARNKSSNRGLAS